MSTDEVLALVSKDPYSWTEEEEFAASDLLSATPEPLPEPYVTLLHVRCEAEEARLRRGGATSADLDD
jgi:hypothetical protein